MIISHKNKFIFLKTRKTAGTSVEISLSRYCGKDDVITPIMPEDEKIREKFKIYPQNYLSGKAKNTTFKILKKIGFQKPSLTPIDQGYRFWNHAPASYVKKEVGDKIWNSYFKFCFDRNPWDKTVSVYYWNQATQDKLKGISFSEYLKTDTFRKIPHYNYPIYSDENAKLLVDFVGKYENLENDLAKICKQIGIDFDGWLPHAKGSYRKQKKHYSEYFNKEQAKYIQEYFKKEIELQGYKFERDTKEILHE